MSIGGSVIATDTGAGLFCTGDVTSVKIGGDLRAGTGFGSAGITSLGKIGAFKAGAFTAPLTTAATPDAPIYLAPTTLNVSLIEV